VHGQPGVIVQNGIVPEGVWKEMMNYIKNEIEAKTILIWQFQYFLSLSIQNGMPFSKTVASPHGSFLIGRLANFRCLMEISGHFHVGCGYKQHGG
jgi:hypothetical protein